MILMLQSHPAFAKGLKSFLRLAGFHMGLSIVTRRVTFAWSNVHFESLFLKNIQVMVICGGPRS